LMAQGHWLKGYARKCLNALSRESENHYIFSFGQLGCPKPFSPRSIFRP